MKRVLILLALGALAPMIQGVAGTFVEARYCPDLSMLLVMGLGLYWRSAGGGASLAALFGFVADLLSGSLFGHHALLAVFVFGAARLCSRKLNLRGALTQVAFAVALTGVHAVASALLTAFFAAGAGPDWALLRGLLPHALVNGAFAPLLVGLVNRVASWDADEGGRPLLTLPPRKRMI